MSSILDQIISTKRDEISKAQSKVAIAEIRARARDVEPRRDFAAAIRHQPKISLIAEIKRSSPSRGLIRADFEPTQIAQAYYENGATCLSVLTDESYFGGHLDYLASVRQTVPLPLLRKDFIIDDYQLYEALVFGADAVLLIAECLLDSRLKELHQRALELQLTPLVELYDPNHLARVLDCRPQLVGVNNRDLHTFDLDLERSLRLRELVPPEILFVSESGIDTASDVGRLQRAGVDAILVGESLMKRSDIGQAVRELLRDVF